MRPINNVVDVSNYVMLELGQPNHTYDLAKLEGGGFIIRKAREGESVVTLDGVERACTARDVLICDGNDVPIGIGGVMGGASTEIDEHTTAVALEMAWFDPPTIAATAGRLALRSEASTRFERGADPEGIDRAARRFVELLRHTCPEAVLHSEVDARGVLPDRSPVRLRRSRTNSLLGTDLPRPEIGALLASIGFEVSTGDDDDLLVTVPTWRYDCTVEVDLIEEVARMHGYSRIAKTVPKSPHPGGLTQRQQDRRLVRQVLVGLGASEAMPNPFLAPGDLGRAGLDPRGITIANPLASEESVLRTSLLPGLLKAVAYNESHRNAGVQLFEIGHVYGVPAPGEPLPDEREMLGVALAGRDATAARAVWDELAAALAWPELASRRASIPACIPRARCLSETTERSVRSARSIPVSSRRTASMGGWPGSSSISTGCSRCRAANAGTGPSAASRRRTSTSRSSSMMRSPRPPWSARFGKLPATSSRTFGSSTCIAERRSGTVLAAWRTRCGYKPPTERSPIERSARFASAASTRSSLRSTRNCAGDVTRASHRGCLTHFPSATSNCTSESHFRRRRASVCFCLCRSCARAGSRILRR